MINNDSFFVGPELDYRRSRNSRAIAATRRSGRSRASWLRRLAATDPSLRDKQN